MKKVSKTTKKSTYKYMVNLVDVKTELDLITRFAVGKTINGMAISEGELDAVALRAIEALPKKIVIIAGVIKRAPWYKRLWNWIKRPFCKK